MRSTNSNKKRTRRKLWKQKGCGEKGKCRQTKGGCNCGNNFIGGSGYAPYPSAYNTNPTLLKLNGMTTDVQVGRLLQESSGVDASLKHQSNYIGKNVGGGKKKTKRRGTKKRGGGFFTDGVTNFFRVSGNDIGNVYNGLMGKTQSVSPLPFKDQLTRTISYNNPSYKVTYG